MIINKKIVVLYLFSLAGIFFVTEYSKRLHNSYFGDFNLEAYVIYSNNQNFIDIYLKNRNMHATSLHIDPVEFKGFLYFFYTDGSYDKLVTNDFLDQLMTGPGRSEIVRLNPDDEIMWRVEFSDLVGLYGESVSLNNKKTVAGVFSWVDAAITSKHKNGQIISKVNFTGAEL